MSPLADEIASRLEAMMLHQTHFLIVQRVNSPYYLQFMATPHGQLYAEAVGNDYIDPDSRLDEAADLDLIGLGWSSPTPQFSQMWDEPIPFAEVGCAMARTLVEVYGAQGLADVTFTLGRRTDGP